MEKQLDFFNKKDLKVGDDGSKYVQKLENKARKQNLGSRLYYAKMDRDSIEVRSGDGKKMAPYTIYYANVSQLRSLPQERITTFVHMQEPSGTGAQLVTLRAKTDLDYQEIIQRLGSVAGVSGGGSQGNRKQKDSKGQNTSHLQRGQRQSKRHSSADSMSQTSSSLTAVYTVKNEYGQANYQILRSPSVLRRQQRQKNRKQGGRSCSSSSTSSSSSSFSSSSSSSSSDRHNKRKGGKHQQKKKPSKQRGRQYSSSSSSSVSMNMHTRNSSHLTYYSDNPSVEAHGGRKGRSQNRNTSN